MAGTAAQPSSGQGVLFKMDDAGGECCEAYIGTRDHVTKAHAKNALENAWLKYGQVCPEEPEQFVKQLRKDFHARSWELFLLSVFGDAGLNLVRPPPKGPDIKILLPGNRVCWIEAVVPTPGTGNNKVFQRPPGNWRGSLYPEEQLVLRYRSALEDKLRKLDGYVRGGIVALDDIALIALCQGGIIDSDMHDIERPAILKAVFPIGKTQIAIVPYSKEAPRIEIPRREQLTKVNGASVSTTLFLEERSVHLSGVLFAAHNVWNLPWKAERALRLVHNPVATAPLARGTLPVREWWVGDDGYLCGPQRKLP